MKLELFFDEVEAFNALDERLKAIFFVLLGTKQEYIGLFDYVDYCSSADAESLIRECFSERTCGGADVASLISRYHVELAYCLALINADDRKTHAQPPHHLFCHRRGALFLRVVTGFPR